MHGMLYGRIKMSPHPHAMIKKIDVSRAMELPGVRTVSYTHLDVYKRQIFSYTK